MIFPKMLFKATWLVFSLCQVLLLTLYSFKVGMVPDLLWWQLLTPALFLAAMALLWGLVAMWHGFIQAGKKSNREIDRAKLIRLRVQLMDIEKIDKMSSTATELRRKIRALEKSLAAKASQKSQ